MSGIFDLFKSIETEAPPSGAVSFIVVGLGNPGGKYTATRHNMGFMCLDYVSQKTGIKINRSRFRSLCGEGMLGGAHVLFMKPETYMNLSGEAVREAAAFYKTEPENVIVLCDDINLPAGKMRIRQKGSAGGHNGLANIIYQLNSDAFTRIRIGVGGPPQNYDLADFVLAKIPECEQKLIYACIENTYPALELIIGGDVSGAMGKFN